MTVETLMKIKKRADERKKLKMHHIFATCPQCNSTFIGSIYHDALGYHVNCPSCESSFDVDYYEDDQLEARVMSELQRVVGRKNVVDVPQRFIDDICKDIRETSEYPEYNDSDIRIGIRRTIMNAIYYYAL